MRRSPADESQKDEIFKYLMFGQRARFYGSGSSGVFFKLRFVEH